MFKIIMLVKKLENLSQEEFVRHWTQHSKKVLVYKDILNISRYSKTFPIASNDAKTDTKRKTEAFKYDAMGELWYENFEAFMQGRNSDAGRKALEDLKADEAKFCDMKNSVMRLGNEEIVVEFKD